MEELVEVSIDGRTVEVPKGTLIIDAAEKVGIHIPRLCYLKGLENVGICRICLVQVEGSKRLMPACRTKVKPDMKVYTDTPEVLENRRTVLELILSTHPYECMTCEKSGDCELQRYAYEFGIERTRFPYRDIEKQLMEDDFIRRRLDLCILCGRCVRICKSHGYYVLDFIQRGMETTISTPDNLPLKEAGCTFCGSCIEVCPVGALVETPRVAKGREWEFTRKETLCPFCATVCQTYAFLKDGEIVKVTSQNRQGLCVRGKFGFDAFDGTDRVVSPMIRKDDKLTEVGWDEALDFTAKKLDEIRRRDGADGIGFVASAYFPTETLYLFQKLARCAVGTNNIDNSSSIYNIPVRKVLQKTVGGMLPPLDTFDIEEADCILVIGADMDETHPVAARKMRSLEKTGTKLILVNPTITRKTETTVYVPLRSGEEYNFISVVLNLLLSGGKWDKERVEGIKGFDRLQESVKRFTADKMELTGVSKESVEEVANIVGESKKLYILVGANMSYAPDAESTILQLMNLALLKDAPVIPLVLESNAVGAQLAGAVPDSLPYGYPLKKGALKKAQKLWKVSSLPEKEGLSMVDMIRGGLKALYLLGDIPLTSIDGARKPEFLIVQTFHLNGMAEEADVVLPASSVYEDGGTFVDFQGKVKTVAPVKDSNLKSTAELLSELSARLGYEMEFDGLEGIMAESDKLKTKPGHLPAKFITTKKARKGGEGTPLKPTTDILTFLTGSLLRGSRVSSLLEDAVYVKT